MLKLSAPLTAKIHVLRDLDNKIDFARSTVQLHIIFALMMSQKPLTPTRIAEIIEERRKAVLDALRKLELKGIVARAGTLGGETLYTLSKSGKEYADRLLSVLGVSGNLRVDSERNEISNRAIIIKRLTEAQYLYNAIVLLANSPEMKLELKKLSELMGLSPDRAKSYLDMFSRPPIRVFRRVGRRGEGVHYKLEEKGLAIYKRIPAYQLIKNSILERTRVKLRIRLGAKADRRTIMPILTACFSSMVILVSLLKDQLMDGALSSVLFFLLCLASLFLP